MSQGAWIRGIVREAVEPLEHEIARLHERLRAVEGSGGPAPAGVAKRASRGRTAAQEADVQPAETPAPKGPVA